VDGRVAAKDHEVVDRCEAATDSVSRVDHVVADDVVVADGELFIKKHATAD
jgi:hypothetical protein